MPAAEEETLYVLKELGDINKQVANRWHPFFMQVLDKYLLSVLCASKQPTGSSTVNTGKKGQRLRRDTGDHYLGVPRKSKGMVS